ncbi:MAG: DNA polymerase III subunit delta [Deltaproteobacteria bacterium]|nr:DNA polymerase III subunit delta [Deltaproteobacteria bacterium]
MQDLSPDSVINSLRNKSIAPFYLFYGSEEFWIEITLEKIKDGLISKSARDFNLETFYGGEVSAYELLSRARSIPFMSSHRLIIVRDAEKFSQADLDIFSGYLDNPVDSTCIIWLSEKMDLRSKFFKKLKGLERAVNFKKLTEQQLYIWIRKRAKNEGLILEKDVPAFLYQTIGNNLRDIYNEIVKLSIRYPKRNIGIEEIKELAIFSKLFTIFELLDYLFKRDASHSSEALNRFFDTQGRENSKLLGLLQMLARQIRLILAAKPLAGLGSGKENMAQQLRHLPDFVIKKCISQGKLWQENELYASLDHIYKADELIKSGSKGDIILENLIFRLCFPEKLQ